MLLWLAIIASLALWIGFWGFHVVEGPLVHGFLVGALVLAVIKIAVGREAAR